MFQLEKLQMCSDSYIVDPVELSEISFEALLRDLKQIYNIFFTYTDASSVWSAQIPIFARPDLLLSSNGLKILELNIDTAIVPQSLTAYLQTHYGCIIDSDMGKVAPFVKVMVDLVNKIGKPIALLGTKEKADVFDPVNAWLVEEIDSRSNHPVRYYPSEKWIKAKKIDEPLFVRWFSFYQINRHSDMRQAYDAITVESNDLYPEATFPTLDSKSLLAEMHKIGEEGILNQNEYDLVKKYIPYTEELTKFNISQKPDLFSKIINNKDAFVLKKSQSHAGRDVYVGCQMNFDEWCHAANCALETEDYIVQEYVSNTLTKHVRISDGKSISEKDLSYIVGPFVIDWKIAGVLVRAWDSTSEAGGFQERIFAISKDYVIS